MMATARVLLVSTIWGLALGYLFGVIFSRNPYDIQTELLTSCVAIGCILTGLIWLRMVKYQENGWTKKWLNAATWASLCAIISSLIFLVLSVMLTILNSGPLQLDNHPANFSILMSLWAFLWIAPMFALAAGWLTLAIPILALPWILSLEVAKGKPQT